MIEMRMYTHLPPLNDRFENLHVLCIHLELELTFCPFDKLLSALNEV